MAERKVACLRNAAEETKSKLDQSNRLRRELEREDAEGGECGDELHQERQVGQGQVDDEAGGWQRPSRT